MSKYNYKIEFSDLLQNIHDSLNHGEIIRFSIDGDVYQVLFQRAHPDYFLSSYVAILSPELIDIYENKLFGGERVCAPLPEWHTRVISWNLEGNPDNQRTGKVGNRTKYYMDLIGCLSDCLIQHQLQKGTMVYLADAADPKLDRPYRKFLPVVADQLQFEYKAYIWNDVPEYKDIGMGGMYGLKKYQL